MKSIRILSRLTVAVIFCQLGGCASVGMLPTHVDDVSFKAAEGKTGWSKYEQVETFVGCTPAQVYAAAKSGLGRAGFALRRGDANAGLAIGEHGMTAHDWNVIAGVYFKSGENGTLAKVIIEGSKDIGFSGDVTSDGWSGKIIAGMYDYLLSNGYLQSQRTAAFQ